MGEPDKAIADLIVVANHFLATRVAEKCMSCLWFRVCSETYSFAMEATRGVGGGSVPLVTVNEGAPTAVVPSKAVGRLALAAAIALSDKQMCQCVTFNSSSCPPLDDKYFFQTQSAFSWEARSAEFIDRQTLKLAVLLNELKLYEESLSLLDSAANIDRDSLYNSPGEGIRIHLDSIKADR